MNEIIKGEEIDQIVQRILESFDGEKNIDEINIFNKPDKTEVHALIQDLFGIIYPGYFRDRSYKTYNPKNSLAVSIEDIFYHLEKQVYLALDYGPKRGAYTEEERKKESYRICKAFFDRIPMIREYIETDLLATLDGDPRPDALKRLFWPTPDLWRLRCIDWHMSFTWNRFPCFRGS